MRWIDLNHSIGLPAFFGLLWNSTNVTCPCRFQMRRQYHYYIACASLKEPLSTPWQKIARCTALWVGVTAGQKGSKLHVSVNLFRWCLDQCVYLDLRIVLFPVIQALSLFLLSKGMKFELSGGVTGDEATANVNNATTRQDARYLPLLVDNSPWLWFMLQWQRGITIIVLFVCLFFRVVEWLKFWDHMIIDIVYQAQTHHQTTATQRASMYRKGVFTVSDQVGGLTQPDPIPQLPSCSYLEGNAQVRAVSGYYHGDVTNFRQWTIFEDTTASTLVGSYAGYNRVEKVLGFPTYLCTFVCSNLCIHSSTKYKLLHFLLYFRLFNDRNRLAEKPKKQTKCQNVALELFSIFRNRLAEKPKKNRQNVVLE